VFAHIVPPPEIIQAKMAYDELQVANDPATKDHLPFVIRHPSLGMWDSVG